MRFNYKSIKTLNKFIVVERVMIGMDVTSVPLGKRTRDCLKTYRDYHDLPNYNQTILHLLEHADLEESDSDSEPTTATATN